jgi:MoxR-like ATPase
MSDKAAVDQLVLHYKELKEEIHKVIIGQDEDVDQVLISIFSRAHCLLVGVPGLAKTLLVNTIAETLGLSFNRIQFTPDLMPSDIVGSEILDESKQFKFIKGPLFSNVILADEINRTPPKTQSALLEAMQERRVTTAGKTFDLPAPFFVLATQNPIEQEGTYSLPEAQLDRFIFRIKIGYPSLDEEQRIIQRFYEDFDQKQTGVVQKVITPAEIASFRQIVEKVHIRQELLHYIAAVIHNTRNNGDLFLGASPRASLSIMKTSKAIAAISGRDYVTPDDIKSVAFGVLNHRLILSHEREMEGRTIEEIISDILKKVEVPR